MKPYILTLLFTLPLFTSDTTTTHRRNLHQPLFPATSSPPPSLPTSDNPFFHEHTPDQPPSPLSPPPPDTAAELANNNTVAPPPAKNSSKTIAVVVSVGVVTLGMISGLVFFIYKHKSKQNESRKLVGRNSLESPENLPPATFLYIGTVEPARTATESANESLNGSPYHKLNGVKLSDRYRPSPDLQPLPPLSKRPATVPATNSSDDEEVYEFYTPNGSAGSSLNMKRINNRRNFSPKSKRTSPRSRLSVCSSPETISENTFPAKSPAKQPPLPPLSPPIKTTSLSSIQRLANTSAKVIPKIIKPMSSQSLNNDDLQQEDGSKLKQKLKPLHGDKLRPASNGSAGLNEDMMESIFVSDSGGSSKKEVTRKSAPENQILDPKKSHNIAILLRASHVTQEEVYEALVEGNADSLGAELLETLVKMAPPKEEEIKLKDYRGDISKLGSVERFLKVILDIPFAFKRIEALLYRANFENEVKYLRSSFQTLEAASEELKNNKLFLELLEAVLQRGNRMNVDTNRGEATAFKLDTLLKLAGIKGTDGKTTLLHFVVQEIIRSEIIESNTKIESNPTFNEKIFKKQGLQIAGALSRELSHVKKAAEMDSHVLSGHVIKFEVELQKIKSECDEAQDIPGNFYGSMRMFIAEAETELKTIKIDEKKALSTVKDVTECFDGDSVKKGVYPLRIFMIVRDFMVILDDVCKEVGHMQDRIMVGAATSFRVLLNAQLPNVTIYKTP